MKVFVLEAGHQTVSGRVLKIFQTEAAAHAEAAELANVMLKDANRAPDAEPHDYAKKIEPLQDEYGCGFCYVEVTEHEVQP